MIRRLGLFGYVVLFFSRPTLPAECISSKINNIAKFVSLSNSDAREVEFGSKGGGKNYGYNGVGFVEIS